jgi:hypothetical protein
MAGSVGTSMRLWHHRMAHLGPAGIKNMANQNLVKGLRIDAPEDFDHSCHTCANGKSHLTSIPKLSSTEYAKNKLVIMDLSGPVKSATWDGYLYTLIVVEASCCWLIGCLLRKKDEAGQVVRDILTQLEQQSGARICRI